MGTIFVAGIYGVGKSTLCNNLSKKLKIPAYSAGDLISLVNGEQYGVNKVVTDKILNQDILEIQIHDLLKTTTQILLAGHFCIFDKNTNVDYLPRTIFSNLEIEKIILLEAPVSVILKNLSLRDKKAYTYQQLLLLQNAEVERAKEISCEFGYKLYIHNMTFDNTDISECLSYIREEKL